MDKSSQALTEDLLQRFLPLAQLQDLQRELLLQSHQLQIAPAKTVLFKTGENDSNEYFLVEGKVKLTARDGKERIIEGNTFAARYAIAHLRPRQYSATTLGPIRYLMLSAEVLKELEHSCLISHSEVHEHPDLHVDAQTANVLAAFEEDLAAGQFHLPAMPDVALRLREKLGDPDVDIHVAAKLISTELAVASRIVQAANSPLYRRGAPCNTIQNAIMRLGLQTTRHLVLTLLMHEMFDNRHPLLRKLLQQSWRHNVAVAATSCALARRLKLFSAEEALLAGLVHDIGVVAIIAYAQHFPALLGSERKLLAAIDDLRDVAGVALLKHWRFPAELIEVAAQCHDVSRYSETPVDLCDLVILARHFTALVEPGAQLTGELPAVMKKLPAEIQSRELSTAIQLESRELLADIGKLLF